MAAIDNLWAPWRLEYVRGEQPAGCVLCAKPAGDDDADALIVARGTHMYAVLNLYPYNPGHLMVVPYRHVANLEELTVEESAEGQAMLAEGIRASRRAFGGREGRGPGGFNVGLNLGSAAGAGIPDHLHWQLVPRWAGDTNFMPVLADIRVMAQHMQTTWQQLHDTWGTNEENEDGV
ncbi:MAG: family hydrolase [Thermoleophilia bacterium]|nr:family hydrolase [Thermoleophilia bacterium]MCZ4496299.1 family hydrolase [Thermoleophilia bacterium]